ncbi:MAG: methyltransferase domain-containing protein [Verrucomicrobia bacterium]|nr:methyltransferase domain-containing protein [Verrucomicrobiota bacterium]
MITPEQNELEWTGERYVPQIEGAIALEHLHRYLFASEYVEGKDILDIASGEGYGSEILSRTANHVYGVDIDVVSVKHAQRKYSATNLEYLHGSCIQIPLPESSVDVVVSFETIEHIADHEEMMKEVKRVLRPGGILIISSPEKDEYDKMNQKPNPFHLKELSQEDFKALLSKHFKHSYFSGQRVLYGSALVAIDGNPAVSRTYNIVNVSEKIESTKGLAEPVYIVAVCSDNEIQENSGSLCEQNILENEPCLVPLQKVSLLSKESKLTTNKIAELKGVIATPNEAAANCDVQIGDLQTRVTEKDEIIKVLENQFLVVKERMVGLEGIIDSIKGRLIWKLTTPISKVKALCSTIYCKAGQTSEGLKKTIISKRIIHINKNILSIIKLYLSEEFRSNFNEKEYLDSRGGPCGWWVKSPRIHYCIFNYIENPLQGYGIASNITAWVNHYRHQLVHLDKTKKTVLLVTHEISRTGAPILVLNLAEKLKQYYTVIILSMGGGSLLEEFTGACDLFIGPLMKEQSMPDFLCGFLKGVKDLHPIDCALVNCIVSTPILRPLWKNNIPASHLIHEFSSYTRPETTFNESAFFSAKQIFSSKLVLENALSDYPNLANKSPLIMPQGRCLPPLKPHGCDKGVEERSRIDSILRPPGSPENLVVVIGLGTVQLRKGVDLFLECAHKVSKLKSKVPIRFVWIGHGYNVKLDGDYSVYLHDQIKRSGIEQMCAITHETDQLDHVYETADILFLSSRLDPLPLVSQDMMAHGKPVLCFEKATGLAEFLNEEPTVGSCVIDYMDVDGAASRIVELANDHSEYQRVGKAFEAVLGKTFNLDRYAEKIHEHCEELIAMEEAEKEDHEIIMKSGLLDDKFFRHHAAIDQYQIKAYMSLWSMGLDHRKPFPGFHPGIYAERNQISQGDPFAEYIRQGKPAGPWIQEVITPGDVTDEDLRKALVPTALHLHLYYTEMADAILASIARCKSRPDLLISVGDQASRKEVEEALLKHGLEAKRIAIVPNRGRDIGPFLTEFGKEITDNYEIVGHLHSKNTLAIEDRGFVRNWTYFLYGNLLGEQAPMMDIILKKMEENPTIGLIYPDDPFVVGWGENKTIAEKLLNRMKISGGELYENINFPVGTMFWARTKALKPLFDLNLDWGDYQGEPLPYDGSMLHAIERMLTIIAEQQNFKTAVTNNPTVTR